VPTSHASRPGRGGEHYDDLGESEVEVHREGCCTAQGWQLDKFLRGVGMRVRA